MPELRPLPLAAGLLLALLGCSTRYDPMEPRPLVAPPGAFAAAAETEARVLLEAPWWTAFRDPELTALIEAALAGNLDMTAAWARLRQARALAGVARAVQQPTADLTASDGRSQLFFPGRGALQNDRAAVTLPLGWEVDLFGKLDAAASASQRDRLASRADLEALALSLSADLATSFVGLKEQRARRRLLEEQLATNQDLLGSLRVRFTQGQSSSLDYYQQEQLVQGRRAQLRLIGGEEARLQNRLAVLVGEAPGAYRAPEGDELARLPPLPPLGVPADLLLRRPDLRAAQARVEAADRRVAEALRDRLPSIRLGASAGYQAADPSGLFRNVLRSLTGDLVLPLLDGGRRARAVAQRRAQVDEQLARYSQSFLLALEEVETTLSQEAHQQRYLDELEVQEETARRSFSIATARYQEGGEDFIRVLTALGTLQQIQEAAITARAQLLRLRIQLCRALGGDWTGRLREVPRTPPRTPTPKEGNA